MTHKSFLIPGLSRLIDESVLSHYPANSMKRILMAGAVSLYLKQNEALIDSLLNNPLIAGLGVVKSDGMIDIDMLRDTLKNEIKKAGFMRISLPIIGDVDFTPEDVDLLHRFILEASANASSTPPAIANMHTGGVY